jgi:hypothetical protein
MERPSRVPDSSRARLEDLGHNPHTERSAPGRSDAVRLYDRVRSSLRCEPYLGSIQAIHPTVPQARRPIDTESCCGPSSFTVRSSPILGPIRCAPSCDRHQGTVGSRSHPHTIDTTDRAIDPGPSCDPHRDMSRCAWDVIPVRLGTYPHRTAPSPPPLGATPDPDRNHPPCTPAVTPKSWEDIPVCTGQGRKRWGHLPLHTAPSRQQHCTMAPSAWDDVPERPARHTSGDALKAGRSASSPRPPPSRETSPSPPSPSP